MYPRARPAVQDDPVVVENLLKLDSSAVEVLRPGESSRCPSRANLRHGVSQVKCGTRFTLGVIFHDSQ